MVQHPAAGEQVFLHEVQDHQRIIHVLVFPGDLEEDGQGGTDVTLIDEGVPSDDRTEVIAGWVSVLLALKASVDFNVDLRTHDPDRQWDQGYAEN